MLQVIVGKFVGPMEVLEKNYEIVNSGYAVYLITLINNISFK